MFPGQAARFSRSVHGRGPGPRRIGNMKTALPGHESENGSHGGATSSSDRYIPSIRAQSQSCCCIDCLTELENETPAQGENGDPFGTTLHVQRLRIVSFLWT